jgi:DNA repair protein RecO (recombination protein O)
VPLDRCADGEPIDADALYLFGVGQGAQRLERGDADDGSQVSGRTLLAMAARRFDDERVASEAKGVLRRVIRYHLGGKPLNTRRILQDLKQL